MHVCRHKLDDWLWWGGLGLPARARLLQAALVLGPTGWALGRTSAWWRLALWVGLYSTLLTSVILAARQQWSIWLVHFLLVIRPPPPLSYSPAPIWRPRCTITVVHMAGPLPSSVPPSPPLPRPGRGQSNLQCLRPDPDVGEVSNYYLLNMTFTNQWHVGH